MVLVKATLQNVVRRFSQSDDVSYSDLRSKLVSIFPELEGTAPDSLTLYYKDPDGDLVSISSDDELQTAMRLLGEDKTIKLLIGVSAPQEKEESSEEADTDLFDLILTPFHQPISNCSLFPSHSLLSGLFDIPMSWSDHRRMLRDQEERIQRRRQYEEKMRKAHLEHFQEMRKKEKEERKRQARQKRNHSHDIQRFKSVEGSQPVVPDFPSGWKVAPFGSWNPLVYHSPLSTTHVWGPWGYTATYVGDEEDREGDERKDEQQSTVEEKQ